MKNSTANLGRLKYSLRLDHASNKVLLGVLKAKVNNNVIYNVTFTCHILDNKIRNYNISIFRT